MEPTEYLTLFISVVQNIAGKLVPDEITIITIGALVAHRELSITLGFMAVYLGVWLVLATGYGLGVTVGAPVFKWIAGKTGIRAGCEGMGSQWQSHFRWVLCLSLFFPFVRHLVPFLAGMNRMPVGQFALFSIPSSLIWTFHYFVAGYWFGDRYEILFSGVYTYCKITLVGICIVAVTYVLIRQAMRHGIAISPEGVSGREKHGGNYRSGRG